MFHTLMTLATTATVVLHALLGCCVHHAHAGQTLGRCLDTVVTAEMEPHVCDGHACHSQTVGETATSDSDGGVFIAASSTQFPCSHSHGPHDSCAESDCVVIADQRGKSIELVTLVVGSSLPADRFQSSWRERLLQRALIAWPPDPPAMAEPLRVQNQVWRL